MVVTAPNSCTDTKGKETVFSKGAYSEYSESAPGRGVGGWELKAGLLLFAMNLHHGPA